MLGSSKFLARSYVPCLVALAALAIMTARLVLAQCADLFENHCMVAASCNVGDLPGGCEPCGTKVFEIGYLTCNKLNPGFWKECETPDPTHHCYSTYNCLIDNDIICGVQNGDPDYPLRKCTGPAAIGWAHQHLHQGADMNSGDCPNKGS